MQRFTTRGPPTDGGYPIDSDLHQMTDDGGPHTPGPARWSDPDWRDNLGDQDTFVAEEATGFPDASQPAEGGDAISWDNLGERDTFEEEVAMGFPDASRPGVVTVRTPTEVTTQHVRNAVGSKVLEADSWSSVVVEGNPGSVWTSHRSHAEGPIGPCD